MSGRKSWRRTDPSVTRSICTARSGVIAFLPDSQWLTDIGVTPIFAASAEAEPQCSIAFWSPGMEFMPGIKRHV